MKRSTGRIRTTHTGSMPRAPESFELQEVVADRIERWVGAAGQLAALGEGARMASRRLRKQA